MGIKHSKKQILKSNSFKEYRDILNVLLSEGAGYEKEEVKRILEDFLKGETD